MYVNQTFLQLLIKGNINIENKFGEFTSNFKVFIDIMEINKNVLIIQNEKVI